MAIVYILGDICAMANIPIITVIISLSVLAWLIINIILKKYKSIYLSFLIVFFMAYGLTKQQLEPNLISSYITDETSGVSVNIIGIVDKIQEKETYKQIYLRQNTITLSQNPEVSSYSSGIILNVDSYTCDIGDTVRATGKLKEFPSLRNTGGFDSKLYYKTINMEFKCTGMIVEIIQKNENEILPILNNFKNKLKLSYGTIADEKDAGLYDSIVLGDNEGMLETISDLYKDNGIAHLLAISGMQISMIGMLLYKLLRKVGIQFVPCAIVSLAIVICYGIITGNGVSTIRAIIMFVAVVGAGVCGRTYDMLSATSLAAVVILMESPTMFLNCGFLLSFGAILGMIIITPAINSIVYTPNKDKKNNAVIKFLVFSASMSFSINLATLPVILYFYFQIPIYSVFINIILIPLMAFVMLSACFGGLLGMVNQVAGIFLIGMAHYILNFYEMACIWFLKLPYSIVIVGQPSIVQIIVYYLILIVIVAYINYIKNPHDVNKTGEKNKLEGDNKGKDNNGKDNNKTENNNKTSDEKKMSRYVLLLIPIMVFIICYRSYDGLEINMIDVGQGDSICVRTPQNTTYLFDGGSSDVKNVGKYRIVPFLKASGVRTLDYIVVSHMDADHINGIIEMLADDNCFYIDIKNVILPEIKEKEQVYIALEDAIKNKGINIMYVNAGDEFGDKSVTMKCLHPAQSFAYTTRNGYSTTVSLNYKNFDMLFTGDLETDGEDAMIDKKILKNYDVLKVAHHGSMYSSQQEFLDIIKPEIAIISCGIKNSYGHPHQELINRLKSHDSEIYITTQSGEISIKTDGNRVGVERFLKTN